MKLLLPCLLFFITSLGIAQTEFVSRPADNTTGIISTRGLNESGVYCADYFSLTQDTDLYTFFFPGFTSSGEVLSNYLIGADLFIYRSIGGVMSGDMTVPGSAFLELTNIQLGWGLEFTEDQGSPQDFIVYTTDANNGIQTILPAGEYWISFAPIVSTETNGAGRWNWTGSMSALPLYEPLLIDADDIFGLGVTEWTTISEVIDADFPSFAWIGTDGGGPLNIATFNASKLSLYPNPAKESVKILNPQSYGIDKIIVTNLLGEIMGVSLHDNWMDVSHLAAGVYLVTIKTNKGEATKKLVVH